MQPGPVKSLLKNCNDGISAISIPTLNRQLHLLPLLHSIMPLRQLEMQHICWLWEHHHKPCQIWRNRSTLLFHGHETKKTSTNNSNNYPKSSLQIDDGHDTMDNKYNESSSYGESSSTSIQQQYNTHPITAQDVVSNKSILSNSFGNRVSSFRLAILFMV